MDEPIEVGQSFYHFVGIGVAPCRVLAPYEHAIDLPRVHHVAHVQPRIRLAVVCLGQPRIAEVVFLGGLVAEERLEQAHRVLGSVLPPVRGLGIRSLGSVLFQIRFQSLLRRSGDLQIPGNDMEQQTSVRGPLNVRLSAKGVDSAAGYSYVAQEQLNDGACANDLRSYSVVGPAQSVQDATGLVSSPGGRIHLVHLQQIFRRSTRNLGHLFRRVSGIVLLEKLKDAPGILERRVFLRNSFFVPLEGPVDASYFLVSLL